MNILGISGLYHDSAACLIQDGDIVAAAQEERFTRKKHDARLPFNAIDYCLDAGQVKKGQLDLVVFYDKPISKFARLLTTYAEVAPSGLKSFLMAIPVWLKDKSLVPYQIERYLVKRGHGRPREFMLTEHHHSHAASAFFPSPFQEAAVMTIDGVGEWTTTAIYNGEGNHIEMLFEQRFPHSLGLLYSAFTYYTGFKVNSGEYKLMGLAPYGEPVYADLIKEHLVTIREDGSFHLALENFNYLSGLTMTNDKRFAEIFGGPPRRGESEITKREMDLARSIQAVTEEILLKMARYARSVTGKRHLCLAGGVALNCVANGKLLRSGIFDDIWIQPAAGDAGGALGAALYAWHDIKGKPRQASPNDSMKGSLLGPSFSTDKIKQFLDQNGFPYQQFEPVDREKFVAKAIADEKVIGMFQGRMEFGPRALCNRSIIGDARSPKMQSHLNLATKFRESFRPFAPAVLEEDVDKYFNTPHPSPYMLLVDEVRPERHTPGSQPDKSVSIKEWVNIPRSDVPAITHVDYTGRVQTVDETRNPRMHAILQEFKKLTGESIVINTSFNVRGEPIVCTPEDAYRCFMRTGMDVLVLEDLVLLKDKQPALEEQNDWREEFALD